MYAVYTPIFLSLVLVCTTDVSGKGLTPPPLGLELDIGLASDSLRPQAPVAAVTWVLGLVLG